MLKASYKDTCKSDNKRINENLRLKSEVYEDAKAICTEKRRALSSIKP